MRKLSHRGKWGRSKSGTDIRAEQESLSDAQDDTPSHHLDRLLALEMEPASFALNSVRLGSSQFTYALLAISEL